MNEKENKVKTQFKGPGQWRTQAKKLEAEVDISESDDYTPEDDSQD